MNSITFHNRNDIYDIVRGLLMIFVVLGHCGFPFTQELYSFHVPTFFILSGILYKRKVCCAKSFFYVLYQRVKRLYIPFLGFSLFFTITYNFFQSLNLYVTEDSILLYPNIPHTSIALLNNTAELIQMVCSSFLFSGGTQLCGGIWFLRVLFFTNLILDIECLILRKTKSFNKYFISINLFMGVLGLIFSCNNVFLPLNLNAVPLTLLFCCMGYFIKYHIQNYLKFLAKINIYYSFIFLLLFVLLIEILSNNLYVNIGQNSYSNIFILMITTSIGVLLTFTLASIIKNINVLKLICLSIGLHTISILGLHFLAFKIVNIFIIYLCNKPISYLGAFPVLDSNYWLLYTISGLAIPILLIYMKNFLLKFIRSNLSKIIHTSALFD